MVTTNLMLWKQEDLLYDDFCRTAYFLGLSGFSPLSLVHMFTSLLQPTNNTVEGLWEDSTRTQHIYKLKKG